MAAANITPTTSGEMMEPIAIVGSSCRLPGGVRSTSDLWELLKSPGDIVDDISSAKTSRFNSQGFFHPDGDHHGASNVSQCYLCDDDFRLFDNDFFAIHAGEAEAMDPQQRVLIEVVYEAIEESGFSIESLKGSQTGVFVGQMTDDYRDLVYRDIDGAISQYTGTGVSRAMTANRVSYLFDWHGPSMNIDTACSSSLVALHQAVQSLRSGESSLAVAAGVNLILGPELFIIESKLRMLSPSGRCRMWDESADGYGRGEGVAAVVLKTLRQAIIDQDDIECVIRGTGVNQDGRTLSGLTVPSATSQANLIRSTYAKCGLDPTKSTDRCQYFEAHGTGTAAGDPKEAEAIRNVFFPPDLDDADGQCSKDPEPLYVGSVKTVVGHSEGAAGLVGLLKASLAVQHGFIPPNLHFQKLNPALEPFYNSHLEVPTVLKSWPQTTDSNGVMSIGVPRRASVNSFGFGGTNAHAIIEAWNDETSITSSYLDSQTGPNPQHYHADAHANNTHASTHSTFVFPLSANSKPALVKGLSALSQAVSSSSAFDDLERLAATLQSCRTVLPFRKTVTAAAKDELCLKLTSASKELGESTNHLARPVSRKQRILGVFTGQGAQWPRMGATLYASSPVFRNTISQLEDSLACLPDPPGWSLAHQILAEETESLVHEAEISQPLTTALQIALVDLLRASGVELDVVVGHSSGEIAAAYSSGHIVAHDAIRVAYYRGVCASRAQSPHNGRPGRMIAAQMSSQDAIQLCRDLTMNDRLAIAAINGPSSVTIAGDADAVDEVKTVLDERGTHSRVLKVDKAYHSHHMNPCAARYLDSLRRCSIQVKSAPSCLWYSSVYDRSINADGTDASFLGAEYWVENMTKPVLFQAAVERASREQDRAFDLVIEIGPHPALQSPVMSTLRALASPQHLHTPYFGLLRRGQDDVMAFSDAIGRIWSTPSDVDWGAFRHAIYGATEQRPRPLKGLPSYCWDHDRALLFESSKSKAWRSASWPLHPLLGRVTQVVGRGMTGKAGMMTMTWRNIIRLGEIPWLRGHKFQNQVIIPASGYVSMATDAVSALSTAYLADQLDTVNSTPSRVPTLVELEDLEFHRAIALHEDDQPVELVWVIQALDICHDGQKSQTIISAHYSCYSGPAVAQGTPQESPSSTTTLNFSGKASITISSLDQRHRPNTLRPLPDRIGTELPLANLSPERFYSWLSSLGLNYSQDFVLKSIRRRRNIATVGIEPKPLFDERAQDEMPPTTLFVHPAALDAAFQGLFAAYCFPGDGRMQAPYLPVSIHKIRIDMAKHQSHHNCRALLADCHVKDQNPGGGPASSIQGDVDLFCTHCEHPMIQVEDIKVSRLSKPGAGELDPGLFARTIWETDFPSCGFQSGDQHSRPAPGDGKVVSRLHKLDSKDVLSQEARQAFSVAVDRVAFFQLKRLSEQNPDPQNLEFSPDAAHLKYLLQWADRTVERVRMGQHPRLQSQWIDDGFDTIKPLIAKYHPDHIEMQLVCAVGERLPSFVNESRILQDGVSSPPRSAGATTMLDILMQGGKLPRLYHTGVGFREANNLVGVAAGRLARRYPTMRILEIGAGSGAATASVLEHIGDNFGSYTFTDISSAFFADGKDMLKDYLTGDGGSRQERVKFAVLDIERVGEDQNSEFQDESFDLIVASNVLHATRSLKKTLDHCRRLLRPGGWLVIDELTTEMLYGPFIVAGLAGWWLGSGPEGDGRINGPTVSEDRWNDLLRQSGFSGVDHLARDTDDDDVYHSSVMVTQAVDGRIELLRQPLNRQQDLQLSGYHDPLLLRMPVVILGCGNKDDREVSRSVMRMQELLQPVVSDAIRVVHGGFEALSDAANGKLQAQTTPDDDQLIPPGSAILCILNQANPDNSDHYSALSRTELTGLKQVFNTASYVLFVTGNPAGGDPRAAAILGIGRTVMCESPHLRVHFIHIDEHGSNRDITLASGGAVRQNTLPSFLVEMFLRMILLDRDEFKDVLWSNETEMLVGDREKLLIPRVCSDPHLNGQLSSPTAQTEQLPMHLIVSGAVGVELPTEKDPKGRLALRAISPGMSVQTQPQLRLNVLCSSFFAFSTRDRGAPQMHICLGSTQEKPAKFFVAISPVCSSSIVVAEDQVVELDLDTSLENTSVDPTFILRHIIAVLLCEDLLHGLPTGSIWLHDPSYDMASIAVRKGQERGIDVFLSASLPSPAEEEHWKVPVQPIFIHPRSTQRQLKLILPAGVKRLVLCRPENDLEGRHLTETAINAGIISDSQVHTLHQDAATSRTMPLNLTNAEVWRILAQESGQPTWHSHSWSDMESMETIRLDEIHRASSEPRNRGITTVVSWSPASQWSLDTCIPIQPAPRLPLPNNSAIFSPGKTYLLVGLSGQLGMSLIEWMASAGAKHFALMSRNPEVEISTLAYLRKRLRLKIHTWAVDVSDMAALKQAHTEMTTRPDILPIGGVANGAMILRDRPFSSMSSEEFEDAMRPKARGTLNLDRLFHNTIDLDFFVLFASSGSLVGNAGQANYNAANLYMACIAEQRRARGLAASVLYLGAIASVGHVAKAVSAMADPDMEQTTSNMVESQLRRFSNLAMSEQDFHKAFAAAVASGSPDSGMDTCLTAARLGEGQNAPWQSQPRFSVWVSQHARQRGNAEDGGVITTEAGVVQTANRLTGPGRSIRQELAEVLQQSQAEGVEVLEKAIAGKLGVVLQTPASRLEQNKNTPFISLGVDSLVAVEVRSWVLKEVSVDVPIFKILGGWSLVDMAEEVIAQFKLSLQAETRSPDPTIQNLKEVEASTKVPASCSASQSGDEEFTMGAQSSGISSASSMTEVSLPTTRPSSPINTKYQRVGDMSPAQARLYFLHQYLEVKSAYSIGYVGKYHGRLDLARLQDALTTVCTAHESLRSCYFLDAAHSSSQRTIQAVLPVPNLVLDCKEVDDEEQVWEEVAAQRTHVFDIEHGQLLRVTVMTLGPELHHILFLHHHIAMDGVGWLLFVKDLDRAFRGIDILPPAQQSIDLSAKQLSRWRSVDVSSSQPGASDLFEDRLRKLAFWQDMHRNPHDPLPLFAFSKVRNRKVLGKYDTETVHAELDVETARRVKQTAARLGVTPFHFYLSALAVFLRCCLDVDDLSIGIVDANRPDMEDGSTMGYFLNMLPLRFRLGCQDQSFAEVARRCRDSVMDVLANRRAPLDAILDHLQTSRSGSHHPLFQVALDYRQGYQHEQRLLGDGIMRWDGDHSITAQNPYDIFVNITQLQGSDRTAIHWTMQRYMYDAEDSRLLMGWYARLLDNLARDPDVGAHVGSGALTNERDLVAALELGNAGTVDDVVATDAHTVEHWDCSRPENDTLMHQVERIAHRYPDSIAIIDDVEESLGGNMSLHQSGRTLAYSQMMERTSQIAELIEACLQGSSPAVSFGTVEMTGTVTLNPNIVIGTALHPSSDYVCSLLGILHLGHTCIGLDLRNPAERLRLMLSDCQPRILICNNATEGLARNLGHSTSVQILNLDEAGTSPAATNTSCVPSSPSCSPSKPAVVLYTSGSTGTPKGVLLSHRNLYSHIKANSALFHITRQDAILQQTSPGFDFCLDQIFHALANGGRLVMVGRHGRGDPAHLAKLIVSQKVTITVGCPSEYTALLNFGGWADLSQRERRVKWRLAFSGGEKLTAHLRGAFERLDGLLRGHGDGRGGDHGLRLVNVYGPTEVTIACARGFVPPLCPSDGDSRCGSNSNRGDYLLPMPGYEIRVTDINTRQHVPVGFPGEICIAGEGVALGYLNRDEETRARFIREDQRPQSGSNGSTTSRVYYRSGDYGRLLEDGSLHILGRIDMLKNGATGRQVKIRGMRVELDEISNVMLKEAGGALNAVAVSYRGDMEGGFQDLLVAFVVLDTARTAPGTDGDGSEDYGLEAIQRLRSRLPLSLPSYMCPSLIIPVDKLPVNVNGKLDAAAVDRLPLSGMGTYVQLENSGVVDIDQERTDNRDGGLLPLSASAEHRMKQVWHHVLGEAGFHHAIGPDSDFFQVGGSSMSAIKLRAAIRSTFSGIVLSLPDIFRLRTLRSMAASVLAHETGFAHRDQHEEDEEIGKPLQAAPLSAMNSPDGTASNFNLGAEIAALFSGLSAPHSPSPPLVEQCISACKQDCNHPETRLEVFLTGATGFLGRHILKHLLSSPRVSKVHCLVRRRLLPTVFGGHEGSDKIVEHLGDLSQPHLGLSAAQFAVLSRKVHVIIHNGAEVSFLQPYEALRKTNVLSTRTICSMALARRIPIHFLSSAAVAGLLLPNALSESGTADECHSMTHGHSSPALGPFSVVASLLSQEEDENRERYAKRQEGAMESQVHELRHRNGSAIGHGYVLSKAVSEALLERSTAEFGVPTFVHRVASIVSTATDSMHGVAGRTAEYDIIGALLKYSRAIGALPLVRDSDKRRDNDNHERAGAAFQIRGAFDFVSVEEVSTTLVSLSLESVVTDTPCINCQQVGHGGSSPPLCITSKSSMRRSADNAIPNDVVSRTETRYVHHCSNEKIAPGQLREHLTRMKMMEIMLMPFARSCGENGADFKGSDALVMSEMDAREWLMAAREEGLDPVLYEYLSEVVVDSSSTFPLSGSSFPRDINTHVGQRATELYMPVISK